ncbi:hypothetical protein E2C01_073823 [Portunus trituberculatus]|uniref:Uncharacterized protein n=1 Tax=Portunus trituberculatus TaxID=210409 RepID=A0A5B7I6D5_PORTR|nr:hypothetical protein [Portunus trituberculatus]
METRHGTEGVNVSERNTGQGMTAYEQKRDTRAYTLLTGLRGAARPLYHSIPLRHRRTTRPLL